MLGNTALAEQDYAKAREWWLRGLAVRRTQNDKPGIAASTGNLAIGAFMEERYDEARSLITESMGLFQEMGDRVWYGFTRVFLGLILATQGDAQTALGIQAENLALFRDLGALALIDIGLIGVAHATQLAEQTAGSSQYALRLLGAAARLHETTQSTRLPFDQIIVDGVIRRATQQLDQSNIDAAWADGYRMEWPEAVGYALAHQRRRTTAPLSPAGDQPHLQEA